MPRMKATLACAALLLVTHSTAAEEGALYATFQTSAGKIGVRLLPKDAPKTVQNFVELAEGKKQWTDPATGKMVKTPLYNGTLFHRVIPGFMIQGGDPLTKDASVEAAATAKGQRFGTGGPGYEFADELKQGEKLFAKPCVLAMANHGPNTNGSQFFITEGYGDQVPQLEPRPCSSGSGLCGYTKFGEGVCGCELVHQIAVSGNSKTRLEKVVISKAPPTCQ